jgi:hypothetical protein
VRPAAKVAARTSRPARRPSIHKPPAPETPGAQRPRQAEPQPRPPRRRPRVLPRAEPRKKDRRNKPARAQTLLRNRMQL